MTVQVECVNAETDATFFNFTELRLEKLNFLEKL